jgi:hypothetical protein
MTETRTAYDRRWQALALLAMTQFVVVLDAAIVNVALPSIASGSHSWARRGSPWWPRYSRSW